MTALAVGFIVIAVILCIAAVFGLLGVGQIALSASDAVERDGLARGQHAPAWTMTDSAGVVRTSPPRGPLQMVVFADHSLSAFPSVVTGLRAVDSASPGGRPPGAPRVEIVILTRGRCEDSIPQLERLGLAEIPVLTAGPALYARYNVRVVPFAIFVDGAGIVRASSLLNHDWQVAKLLQIAALSDLQAV